MNANSFTGPDLDRLKDAADQFVGGTRNGTLRGRGKKA